MTETQTIELTGKTWKAITLISLLILVAGVVLIFAASTPAPGVVGVFLGVAGLIIGKVGRWWHHK